MNVGYPDAFFAFEGRNAFCNDRRVSIVSIEGLFEARKLIKKRLFSDMDSFWLISIQQTVGIIFKRSYKREEVDRFLMEIF